MLDRVFYGRDSIKRPTCPFCGMIVDKPRDLTTRRQGEMPVGSCACGAVYSCDESGRNVGSAQIEALVFGCDMDWDLAWSLLPDEDYRLEIVETYDFQNHLIVPGGYFESRRIAGVLVFVRLHDDVLEVTAEGVRKRLERAAVTPSAPDPPGARAAKTHSLTKRDVETCVQEWNIKPLVDAASTDRKLLRRIQRLLYSGDDTLRRRAAEAMGRVSEVVGETSPASVSKLLQGLLYAVTDTAASSWGAFEAIGEIIRHKPEFYAGYLPHLYPFLGDESKRAATIEAIATVAGHRPDLLRKHSFHFQPFLKDPDPAVRGQTARLLGHLGAREMSEDLEALLDDPNQVQIYYDGNVHSVTVGRLAGEALERM
ncbi:MAG: DVU0298 family protein [Thermodesulfobacteriota bacterium]